MVDYSFHSNDLDFYSALVHDLCTYIDEIERYYLNLVLATGKTFERFVILLREYEEFPFERINLYIADDYGGVSPDDSRSCAYDLIELLGATVFKFHSVNFFSADCFVSDLQECNIKLQTEGLDICLLGVGKDGHVAFCYPPVYDIDKDYFAFRKISEEEKRYHVEQGWFRTVNEVPDIAISLTLWGMLNSKLLIVAAQYPEKQEVIGRLMQHDYIWNDFPVGYLADYGDMKIYVNRGLNCE